MDLFADRIETEDKKNPSSFSLWPSWFEITKCKGWGPDHIDITFRFFVLGPGQQCVIACGAQDHSKDLNHRTFPFGGRCDNII